MTGTTRFAALRSSDLAPLHHLIFIKDIHPSWLKAGADYRTVHPDVLGREPTSPRS